jgi:uncharacterized protein
MEKIVAFARVKSYLHDFDHTMDHIELTAEIARYLADREGADTEVCVVAAYLHDIAKNSSNEHAMTGAAEAKDFLKEIEAPESFIDKVQYAISQHDNDLPKNTKEAEVLWDADKLQSIGPLGFARVYGYRMVYGTREVYSSVAMAREYTEFFYDRFYTDTGRKIALNLKYLMQQFNRSYDAIVNVKLDDLLEARE